MLSQELTLKDNLVWSSIVQVVQELKDDVLNHEKLMLHVMGFNLSIDTPAPKFAELGGKVKGW